MIMLKQMFKKVLSKKALPDDLSYTDALTVLESQSIAQRKALAVRPDAAPEMLYYLAKDTSSEVRCAVAGNPSTPIQADQILATDADAEVRCELARKISRLVPGLDHAEAAKLLDQAIGVLNQLADDQMVRVRQIVADELKQSGNVPMDIVKHLAKDMEAIVSVPILEYSPLLGDDDLIEIIASGAASEALCAISRRSSVSGDVSSAIVSTLDIPAVASLLVNKNAQIREETLDQIIENAEGIDSWHEPLVLRPDLSGRAAKRIAGFVASSLIETLSDRNDLPDDVVGELKSRVRTRIDEEQSIQESSGGDEKAAMKIARDAMNNGTLNDEFVQALADDNNISGVIACLSVSIPLPFATVNKIIKSRHGKAICALCWKSGMSMRTAFLIQSGPAKVPPPQLVLAKNGTDYPLTPDEMQWQLDYFMRQKK